MSTRPPLIPRLLLRAVLRGEEREVICGDLEEEFGELSSGEGGARAGGGYDARRWYWRQALKAAGGRSMERLRVLARRGRTPRRGEKDSSGGAGSNSGGEMMGEAISALIKGPLQMDA